MTVEVIEEFVDRVDIIEVVDVGPVGPPGNVAYFPFSKPGFLLAPYTSPLVFPVPMNSLLDSVFLTVRTAPTGSPVILDILKNGTTVYSGGVGRPTIAVGQLTGTGGTGNPEQASFVTGDLIEVQISQVGSSIPGANLAMIISLKRS